MYSCFIDGIKLEVPGFEVEYEQIPGPVLSKSFESLVHDESGVINVEKPEMIRKKSEKKLDKSPEAKDRKA